MKVVRNGGLARAIAESLGAEVLAVREIVGLGEVNHMFVVSTMSHRWVVRFCRDRLDTGDFSKEAWCLGVAKKARIPSPEVVAVGSFQDVPYLVQSFVEGAPGGNLRSRSMFTTLGTYASAIAAIALDDSAPQEFFQRFGRDPKENWQKHVEYNLGELTRDDPLIGLGVYSLQYQSALKSVFKNLGRQNFRFSLDHGDLVPKNTIVTLDGTIVLLDWGSASVAMWPHAALRRMIDPPDESYSNEERSWFADGLGVSLSDYTGNFGDLQLLGAIDLVRWAIDRRPDRVTELASRAAQIVVLRLLR